MSDIFISYSRKDLQVVSALASALEELGYSVWWDVRGLHGGQAFAMVIKGEIDKARCAIVVWSKASVTSEWVHAEASYANNRNPPILLTTVYQDADIPLPFNTRHNEDLRGWKGDPFDTRFQKLLQAVTRYCPHPSNPPGRPGAGEHGGSKPGSGGGVGSVAVGLVSSVIGVAATAGVFLYLQQPEDKPEPTPVVSERPKPISTPVPEPVPVAAAPKSVAKPAKPEPPPRYQLMVNASPENAAITVDGNAYDPTKKWGAGTYTVKASADGYQPVDQTVEIKEQDAQIRLELEAIRHVLTVTTVPADARISLPGSGLDYAPGMLLPPGDYTLKAEADGYQPQEKAFTIATDDETLNVELKPDRLDYEPEMVPLDGGTFTMGCDGKRDDVEGGCSDDEKPAHKVTLKAFNLAKTETTVAQYMACVDAGGCPAPEWLEKGSEYNMKTGTNDLYKKFGSALTGFDYPIVGVSWDNATAYAKWLSKETGKNYRLPTEAEWEYAARGGSDTAYPWGDKASHEFANYGKDECCDGLASGKDKWVYTSPVGSFAANGYGLYDMNGNVYEWVDDHWHGDYKGAPVDGSAWKSGDDRANRVLRGGSWRSSPGYVRSANRVSNAPGRRGSNIGFRLASG